MYAIRRARRRELPRLCEIEQAAGQLFREVGLDSLADEEPRDVEEFEAARADAALWVVDHGSEPVGFALLTRADGLRHLEELAVAPEHGRRGLGARLLETVCDQARREGLAQLTLTTFRDIAWNGPFYRRHGFEPMPAAEVGPDLAKIRQDEIDRGIDVAPREILRRSLDASPREPAPRRDPR